MEDDNSFDWQAAQELDTRLAELHFAKRIASGMSTTDDAVEYLVCHGWGVDEAKRSLGVAL